MNQLKNKTSTELLLLFGVGFLCAVLMVILFFRAPAVGEEHGARRTLRQILAERARETTILTLSNSVAWCAFFGSMGALASAPQFAINTKMVLGLVVTLSLSLASFA